MIQIDTWVRDDATIGFLQYEDFHCCTLELPWEDNQVNISCIPAGIYDAYKYGDRVLLQSVHNRTEIMIHSGNYTSQILGCILVGDGFTYLNSDNTIDVVNSRNTLDDLMNRLPDNFKLSIERHW